MADAYAHRGLWSGDGPPENSMAAFRAAAEAGVGNELDVQLSEDGVPVVFHDPMLERMTTAQGAVRHHRADALSALQLAGTGETIPALADVARALPDGLPVLVELKPSPGDPDDYLRAVDLALFGSRIDASVMSFTASLNGAAQRVMPGRRRGVLVAPVPGSTQALVERTWETVDTLGARYTAIHHSLVPLFAGAESMVATTGRETPPAIAWTVDTSDRLAGIEGHVAGVIFEHLPPALVTG